MIKILALHDVEHSSQSVIDLSCYLAKLNHSNITGVFPDYPSDNHSAYARFVSDDAPYVVESKQKASRMEDAIAHFREACESQGIRCSIHRDTGDPESDIIAESMFADVLVTQEDISFSEEDNQVPSELMTHLLTHAKCPIVLSPFAFLEPKEIVFAYDGTQSSMFALKQLSYLFPQLKDNPLIIMEVANEGDDVDTGTAKLREWLDGKFAHVEHVVREGDPSNCLLEVVLTRPEALLVLGAFGRNAVSRFFKPSVAGSIIKFATIPVFIAHH